MLWKFLFYCVIIVEKKSFSGENQFSKDRTMQKTAIIVAMEKELVSALSGFGEAEIVSEFVGKPVYRIKKQSGEVYILNSGVGEIAAAAATQHAIDVYGAELIVNFGFVGSLKPEFKQGDLVAAKEIIHYEFDTSALDGFETGRYEEFPFRNLPTDGELTNEAARLFGLKKVIVASGNKFICDQKTKSRLISSFGADICEMESAGIVLTALRNGKKTLILKLVSDNADEDSNVDFFESVKKGTAECAKIITKILGD